MTTAYTSLLGFALPVTGELSGTWGDTVNNGITSLLDSAIAGTTTLSADSDVTLTTTQGSSNTAREAILLWTAGGSATRTITAPAQSKIYTVINASSGTQSIILAGAGPTSGVTIAKGESALCAWNGSDFIKISNTAGPGTFTNLTVTGNTSLGDADTDTITQAASYVTGTQLKSAKTATNTLSLAAYDVDGTAYTNLITLTAGNTPTLALTSTGVGTINNMSIGATTASTGAFTTLSVAPSGATNPVEIRGLSNFPTYGAISFNSAYASTTILGLYAGASGDTNLHLNVPTTKSIFHEVAGSTITTTSSTGLAVAPGVLTLGTDLVYDAFINSPESMYFNVDSDANSSNQSFIFGTDRAGTTGGTEFMRISGAAGGVGAVGIGYTSLTSVGDNGLAVLGNVGIGTSSPTVKLQVLGNISAFSSSNVGSAGSAIYYLGAADAKADAQFKYDSATRNLSWKTSAGASDMMTLDASGNLGIGETSIASKLAVTASLPYATVTGSGSGQYGFQLKAGGSDSAGTLVGGLTYNSATGENRILGPQSYNFLTMYAGGSERARIDSSGNLGLGVTPSAWGSGFSVLQLESKAALIGNNGATYLGNNWYSNAGSKYIGTGLAALYAQSVGAHTWYNAPSGTAGNAITFTQAMTLDASGNLFVGATALTSNLNYFAYSPGNTFADFGHITGVASTTSYARFLYAGGVIGSITQNGTTSVNFNGYIVNPSDRKLKTNIVDAPSSLLLIDKIQIRSFDWIAEEKNQSYGVIAQELETVFPEAVNAPINEDGFYGVDYTKLVPMLVKAIQEQQALITTLTARITALEGA